MEDPEIKPDNYSHPMFDKGIKETDWREEAT
jgi:hypothetical protein